MADGLEIIISADINSAVTGLQKVEAQMKKATTSGQVFSANVVKANQSLQKIPAASGQATQSLTNLSRVAQDAPYGFIGIANNINPLLESFQRLKASTGSTGGALKALGKEMTGAGGIGLAVGVVSSLLVVFGDKLFGASKRSKELQKSAEELKNVLDGISKTKLQADITGEGAAASEIAKVSILSEVVKDQTKSYNERNNALLQLQKINKNYFGDLSIEKLNVEKLTKAVNDYSNALIAAEVVKVLGKDVADLNVQKAKELNKYNNLLKEQVGAEKELRKAQSSQEVDRYGNVTYTYGAKVLAAQKNVESLNKSLSKQGSIIQEVDNNIIQSGDLLKNAIQESLQFKPLDDIKTDKVKIKPKKAELDLSKVDFRPTNDPIEVPIDASNFQLKISESERMFGVLGKEFEKGVKSLTMPELFDDSLTEAIKQWEEHQAQLKATANLLVNTLTPAFEDMFTVILTSGNDSFKKLADGAVASIQRIIIKMASLAAVAFLLGPILGLGSAAGAASNSFADVFKSLLGKRAAGGPVAGGMPFLVGERGPELFVPSSSGSILNNNRLTGRGSSGGRDIVRGSNIILATARAGRSQIRVNGI